MIRHSQFVFALAIGFFCVGGTARAQYHYPGGMGYGGYGFGGWGGTVQGSTAAGMGAFAAGAGQYNVNTAAARSMNADTAMQWNSYWQNAQHSVNVERYGRLAKERQTNITSTDAIQNRILNMPNQVDIDRGDAANAILVQVTDPGIIQGSGLARATQQISSDMVLRIPFAYTPAAAVICIDGLRNDIPSLLMSDQLKAQREAFIADLKVAREEIKAGDEVSADTLNKLRTSGKALYEKVDTGSPEASAPDREKALTYLKNLKVYLKMLRAPDFGRALRDVEQAKSTTIGHLLAFMHTYGLRFGPARTQEQQAVYRTLYPMLQQTRDSLMSARPTATAAAPPPPPQGPGQFFRGVDDKDLVDPGGGR